jgi:hypothetical protein
MRREAAAALEQFKTLMEQFLVLLEDFRAGKLSGPDAPAAQQIIPAARMTDLSASGLGRRVDPRVEPEDGDDDKELMQQSVEDIVPLRSSAPSAASILDRRARRETQRQRQAVNVATSPPARRPKPSPNRRTPRTVLRSRFEYADPVHCERDPMHPRPPNRIRQAQSRFLDETERWTNCDPIIPIS